jgi:hypothetical protein
MKSSILLSTIILLAVTAPLKADLVYSLDDGTAESTGGLGGRNQIFANQFTVAAGGERITSISANFRKSNDNGASDGDPVTAYLWKSASNNSDPRVDATVVATVTSTIQSVDTDDFVLFNLPTPVDFKAGDVFFAGIQATTWAVGIDESASHPQSWFFSDNSTDALDPNVLNSMLYRNRSDLVGLTGNFMIRANGVSAVPEPSSAVLLGLVGSVAAFRRRRA